MIGGAKAGRKGRFSSFLVGDVAGARGARSISGVPPSARAEVVASGGIVAKLGP